MELRPPDEARCKPALQTNEARGKSLPGLAVEPEHSSPPVASKSLSPASVPRQKTSDTPRKAGLTRAIYPRKAACGESCRAHARDSAMSPLHSTLPAPYLGRNGT